MEGRGAPIAWVPLAVVLVLTSEARGQEVSSPRGRSDVTAAADRIPVEDGAATERLASLLARRPAAVVEAPFRQTKYVALLRAPLVSAGTVLFDLPDGVRWTVEDPEPFVVDTRGGVLRAGPPDELRPVPPSLAGPLATLPGGFSGLFGAGRQEIEAAFRVEAGGGPDEFRLTPRKEILGRILEGIDVRIDAASGLPVRVVLHEVGGDRSEIDILR